MKRLVYFHLILKWKRARRKIHFKSKIALNRTRLVGAFTFFSFEIIFISLLSFNLQNFAIYCTQFINRLYLWDFNVKSEKVLSFKFPFLFAILYEEKSRIFLYPLIAAISSIEKEKITIFAQPTYVQLKTWKSNAFN